MAGARGSGPGGEGRCGPQLSRELKSPRKRGRRRETPWPPLSEARRAREPEDRGPPPPLAPAPLPFRGLFRAEPWESVSRVEVVSLESGRRGCKSPPPPRPPPSRPAELRRGRREAGVRVRPPATRGPRPQLDRPPQARRRGLNAANQSIKPTPPSPRSRAPPAGPALCLARPPARGLGSWARPLRGRARGARRVPTRG